MAALVMPTLGEPQTCDGPCDHSDCAYWRQIVGKACVLCGQPVTSGQRFHYHDGPKRIRVVKGPPPSEVLRAPSRGGDHDVVHALCDEEHDQATRTPPKLITREWLEAEVGRLRTEVAKDQAEAVRLGALLEELES